MIVCITGNRPQKFPWKYGEGRQHKKYLADLAKQVENLIQSGYDYFITGGALGVDQDFAETVLSAKQVYARITLEIAVPCRTQAERWRDAEKQRYFSILKRADKVTVLSEQYTRFCMQKRNEYMVNAADLVLAYWNGEQGGGTWNTIRYAVKQGKKIVKCLL